MTDESDREKVHVLLQDYLKKNEVKAQVKVFDHPDTQNIFATSESSYALESFDVNPINYILKPIEREKFYSTLDLAISRVDIGSDKSVCIKIKGGMQTLHLSDILYVVITIVVAIAYCIYLGRIKEDVIKNEN